MNPLGKVALLLVVVAVAVVCWRCMVDSGPEVISSVGPDDRAAGAEVGETGTEGTEPGIETRRYQEQGGEEEAEEDAPTMRRGRVVDVYGKGVPGVALGLSGDGNAPAVLSDGEGAFEFVAARGSGKIVSTDPRWATVFAGSTRIHASRASTVVVAPRIELEGRVVDSDGQPVPDARVGVHLPPRLAVDLGTLMDGTLLWSRGAVCDAEGRFELRDVPAVASAELSAALGGYVPRYVELPQVSTVRLELVLDRPADGATVITGVVVDPLDDPVAGARVSAGGAVSRTDERGEFIIDVSDGRTLGRIVAVAKGMQPAVRFPERDAAGKPKWPERVTLRLGPAPRSITGKVLGRDGRPVEGARVWVNDPLVIGMEDEALIAETFLGRKDNPFWAFVLTDASGAFRLDGLLDRAYTLRALDPATLEAVTRSGVQSGTDGVALRMTVDTYPKLRGRVVDRDGVGIPRATVKLTRLAFAVRIAGGPNNSRFDLAWSAPVETDEAGAFTFENVPTEGVDIQASGDAIQTNRLSVTPGMDSKVVILRVDRRRRLKVELAAPTDRADGVKILEASGRHMFLRARGYIRMRWPLEDGRSEVLSVGEGAHTAVFFKGDVEVGRTRVRLKLGQVNTIRF